MAEYGVTRYEGGRAFPNGKFPTKAEAERHATYVRQFHDCPRSDVKVQRIAGADEGPEVDDAGQERGPEAAA